jgi:transcriptional regulator with XRE-family HTH domain
MTLLQVRNKTGLSVSYLSDLERGRTANPSFDTLDRLARCYKMTVVDLLSGVEEAGGEVTPAALPPGLANVLKRRRLSKEWAQLLNRIELRGKRPQTEEDWDLLYLNLRRMLEGQAD